MSCATYNNNNNNNNNNNMSTGTPELAQAKNCLSTLCAALERNSRAVVYCMGSPASMLGKVVSELRRVIALSRYRVSTLVRNHVSALSCYRVSLLMPSIAF